MSQKYVDISFKLKGNDKQIIKQFGLTAPKIIVGVFKPKVFTKLGSGYGKPITANYQNKQTVVPVLKAGGGKVGGKKIWTTDDNFKNILKNSKVSKYIDQNIKEVSVKIFVNFIVSKQEKTDSKKLKNAGASIVKRAYVQMAMKEKPKKGSLNLCYLRTGQTYRTIEAQLEKKK